MIKGPFTKWSQLAGVASRIFRVCWENTDQIFGEDQLGCRPRFEPDKKLIKSQGVGPIQLSTVILVERPKLDFGSGC